MKTSDFFRTCVVASLAIPLFYSTESIAAQDDAVQEAEQAANEESKQAEHSLPSGRTLYQSDFTSLADGDFPSELEYLDGGMQIDTSQDDAMLRFQGGSWFHISLPATLSDNFSIEFDYYTNESYAVLFVSPFASSVSGNSPPSYTGYRQGIFNFFSLANTSVGAAVDRGSESLRRANAQNNAFTEEVVPIRLEVKGKQARIFVDGDQVVILPSSTIHRTDVVEFFYASMGAPGFGYVGNIRIRNL